VDHAQARNGERDAQPGYSVAKNHDRRLLSVIARPFNF
jgi:hypothetical protein